MIFFPAIKDLEKKETDKIYAIVSFTLQDSKPSKVNLSKGEHKALKKLQSNASVVILPAGKGRSTIILDLPLSLTVRNIWKKYMDHINNGPYQLLEKGPTTKIKTKTLKQLKVLKDNEFINNKF